MKKFLRNLGRGLVATLIAVFLVVVAWAFTTLAAGGVVLGSPLLLIIFTYWSKAASSFTEKAKGFVDELEKVLEKAEKEIME